MRIWTIQPIALWEQIERDGESTIDLWPEFSDGYIPRSYLWLVTQLKQRKDSFRGLLPWWCYCRKPDLRLHRFGRTAGEKRVRIELEVAEDDVATFPIWAWHTVYCQDYLAFSKRQYDAWQKQLRRVVSEDDDRTRPPEPLRSELYKSWERLFNPRLPAESWEGNWSADREGVIEVLQLTDVRNVTHFVLAERAY